MKNPPISNPHIIPKQAAARALSGIWKETRATLLLALPIILGQLFQNSLGVIDTLMVGRVSVKAVAACSFANAIFVVPLVFGFGVLGAVSVLVARAVARQDPTETVHLLRRGLILSLALAAILVIAITLAARWLEFFHQPSAVIAQGRPFLLLLTYSIVPMYLFQTLKQFCEAQHQAWPPLLIMVAGVVVNISLNWIFIFGHLGFFAMGLLGAGWATLLTRSAMFVVLAVFVVRKFFRATASRQLLYHGALGFGGYGKLLELGLPTGVQIILEVGAFTTAAIAMGWISEAALAAHQVALSVASTIFMVPLGLSMAVAIRVSHALGSGDQVRARQAIQGSLSVTALFMISVATILLRYSHQVASCFILDTSVIDLAAQILVIAGLFQIFDGMQVVSLGALRGLHDVKVPTLINLCGYWGIGLPTSYLLAFSFRWGAPGIWWGVLVGLAFVACLLTFRIWRSLRNIHAPS